MKNSLEEVKGELDCITYVSCKQFAVVGQAKKRLGSRDMKGFLLENRWIVSLGELQWGIRRTIYCR